MCGVYVAVRREVDKYKKVAEKAKAVAAAASSASSAGDDPAAAAAAAAAAPTPPPPPTSTSMDLSASMVGFGGGGGGGGDVELAARLSRAEQKVQVRIGYFCKYAWTHACMRSFHFLTSFVASTACVRIVCAWVHGMVGPLLCR